jgi:hypothetical protein
MGFKLLKGFLVLISVSGLVYALISLFHPFPELEFKLSEVPGKWIVVLPDGSRYGPASTNELREWAAQGRIGPDNFLTPDGKSWLKAKDVKYLELDWMVELPDGSQMGPINRKALPKLMELDPIPTNSVLVHKSTGQRLRIDDEVRSENKKEVEPPPAK